MKSMLFESSRWSVLATFSVGTFALLLTGCESEQSKKCTSEVKSAQGVLMVMDAGKEASVKDTKTKLESALTVCTSAQRKADVADIKTALDSVSQQLKKLESGEVKKAPSAPKPPTKEMMAKLAKEGDPSCPTGQAYQSPLDKKVFINCKGPSLTERDWAKVVEHFSGLRFQMMSKDAVFEASKGGLVFRYVFDKPKSSELPLCLTIESANHQPWQEVVAATVGIGVEGIEKDKPVKGNRVSWPLKVTEAEKKTVIVLGECPEIEAGKEEAAADAVAPEKDAAAPAEDAAAPAQ